MPARGGARKALSAMKRTYGAKKGTRVFYAKANKHSPKGKGKTRTRGKSMHARTQRYYKKGGRQ